jgi:hypothetical protein
MSRLRLVRLARLFRVVVALGQLPVLQHLIAPVLLTLPPLRVLDTGNRLVRHFDIKPRCNLDNLEGFRMHPVDGDVQMDIVRIFVQAVDGLVVFPTEFFHEDAYRFFHLLRAGLLALSPTHDVVIDRVLAAHGLSGKGYHFLTLCGVAVAEESRARWRTAPFHPGSGCAARGCSRPRSRMLAVLCLVLSSAPS